MYNILFLFSIVSVCYSSVEFEKYFKVCNRNAADLNDCMADAVRKGIMAMIDGIEEMDIPPIDPFFQKVLNVEYNANQITAKMNMTNIYVSGLKDATVHNSRVHAEDDALKIEVDLTAPKIFVKGQYMGEAQYNALKIVADGDFNCTMLDLTFTWKLEGIPEKNGSETYVRVNSFNMRPDVGSMVSYLANNNAETKELTTFAMGFVNQNWKLLYQELLPFAQTNWNKIGVKIANKIFLRVPYDKVLPTGS